MGICHPVIQHMYESSLYDLGAGFAHMPGMKHPQAGFTRRRQYDKATNRKSKLPTRHKSPDGVIRRFAILVGLRHFRA
jgi:hypothetical protein